MRYSGLLLASITLSAASAAAQTEINLTPCVDSYGPGAWCGWFEAPEDRDKPVSRHIQLRLLVLRSSSQTPAEPVVWFPGGPGQAASGLISLATGVYPRVLETRDFVFIGQRGTGESNPLQCTEPVADNPSLAFGNIFFPARMAECFRDAQTHADVRHYHTQAYVDDLAEALTALGYDRVILWGGSGGTRTAQVFMRDHPDRVVAAVLDGVTPIDYTMPVPFSRGLDNAWKRVVADCAAQAECRAAFPDLQGDMDRIITQLSRGPRSATLTTPDNVTVTVNMTMGDFTYAVRGILYNANATVDLPRHIHHAARTGDLGFFAQSHFNRSVALRGTVIAMGLHMAAYCAEDVPRITPALVREQTAGTMLGDYLVREYGGACREWPTTPMPAEWYQPVRSSAPTLVVSGYYDPTTPSSAGDRVARHLENSLHIVVRNVGHGAGFGCAQPAVQHVLVTGTVAGVPRPCGNEPIIFSTAPVP